MQPIGIDQKNLLTILPGKMSVSRMVSLVAIIFILGAGLGVLGIELTRDASPKRAVSSRAVKVARSQSSGTVASIPEASAGTQPGRAESPPPASNPASQPTSILPAGARSSFATLAATLGGEAGLAVAPLGKGQVQTLGALQDGRAWSTMKVPVLTTLLSDYEQSGQTLSAQERTDAMLALEQSDNAAAEALFTRLEGIHGGLVPASEAVRKTLAGAGDASTRINTAPNADGFTTWGQSLWSPTGEVLFYRALAGQCLLDSQDTEYVLGLMHDVIPAQRWGAGEAGYASSLSLGFKGGWGPDAHGDYLVRQTAIVGSGDTGYVLSMIALPSGGTFAEGVDMVSAIATWARRHLLIPTAPAGSCAG
jgi:hypothetical protein